MSGFILGKAGKSPSFQDPGTPLDGLAGTWIPVSSIGLMTGLLGVTVESFDVDSYPGSRVLLGSSNSWCISSSECCESFPLKTSLVCGGEDLLLLLS